MRQPYELSGQSFGRLTVIDRAPNPGTRKNDTATYWNCVCLCGETTVKRGYSLTSGKTNSCGCLKREAPHLPGLIQSQPTYASEIIAARNVWQRGYEELSFDDYYRLAKENCFYCGIEPSLIKKIVRKFDQDSFIYNTLDRIDSNKGHTIDNVVSACYTCNFTKLNRPITDFYDHISRLVANLDKRVSPVQYRDAIAATNLLRSEDLHYARLTSLKVTYAGYNDADLTLEQFFKLTSSNCYYCGSTPTNRRNMCGKHASQHAKENQTYRYNGLDRFDNTIRTHNYDNVVPACKWCNYAKSELTIQKFDDWIRRLQAHGQYLNQYPCFSASSSTVATPSSSTGAVVFVPSNICSSC